MKRRRFKQKDSLEKRLAEEAKRLRDQAKGTPPGVDVSGLSAGPDKLKQLRTCMNGLHRPVYARRPRSKAASVGGLFVIIPHSH
jgi:hypothetical protein